MDIFLISFYLLLRFKCLKNPSLHLPNQKSRKRSMNPTLIPKKRSLSKCRARRKKKRKRTRGIDWSKENKLRSYEGTRIVETKLSYQKKSTMLFSEEEDSNPSYSTHLSIISIQPFSSPIPSIEESLEFIWLLL